MTLRHCLECIVTYFIRHVYWFVAASASLLLFGGLTYLITETQCLSTAYKIHVTTFLGFQNPFELTTWLGTFLGIVNFVAVWLILPELIAIVYTNVLDKMKERAEEAFKFSAFAVLYEHFRELGQSSDDARENALKSTHESLDTLKRAGLWGQ